MTLLRALAIPIIMIAALPAGAAEREVGDTQIFSRIGEPGMPEGIAVRDGVVYVSTHTSVRGNAGEGPSKIFQFSLETGEPIGEITVEGQNTGGTHGLLALAFDAAGLLYAVDRNPPRIIRIDPATEAQEVYATIPDLPACSAAPAPCSPTTLDQAAYPDFIAFAPDGSAFVTDLEAATIFRVPPGGGEGAVWYQDARFDGVFGLNGIAVDPSGSKLFFAMTGSQQPATPAQGIIYTLPIVDEPSAEDLEEFFVFLEPATGPDGIAFGASGRLYVALAGSNQVAILEPDGTEAARFPDPVSNQLLEVPYDLPASLAFDGAGSLFVTNQSFFTANADHWVVFDVWVEDTAWPLIEPPVA